MFLNLAKNGRKKSKFLTLIKFSQPKNYLT